MSASPEFRDLHIAQSLDDALRAVAAGAEPVAGATWLMRAPLRHEGPLRPLVSLGRIDALCGTAQTGSVLRIGAMSTHDSLVAQLSGYGELGALRTAAAKAANPGIRRIATLGGNIFTAAFAASDLLPALLSLDARIGFATQAGTQLLPVEEFIQRRAELRGSGIVTHAEIDLTGRRSAHERLPMRKAGDYPCAIVSVAADVSGGTLRGVRIAVGSVQAAPFRWTALEHALPDHTLDPADAENIARGMADALGARDGTDAPGWYRKAVLPPLVRRALATLAKE